MTGSVDVDVVGVGARGAEGEGRSKVHRSFFPFLAAPFLLTQLPLGAPLLLLLVVYFALTSASNNLQRSPSLVLTTIRKRPG